MRLVYMLLMFVTYESFAQKVLTNECNSYRLKDRFDVEMIGFPFIDRQQTNLLIDISALNTRQQKQTLSFYPVHEEQIMQVLGSERTYFVSNDSLLLRMGEENNLCRLVAEIPEKWLVLPMNSSDVLTGYYSLVGHYCHRQALRKSGSYQTMWRGEDRLLLENGDTLFHVHRLQTDKEYFFQTLPIDTLQKDLSVFTTDSVRTHFLSAKNNYTETIFRWYADGYRYPILESHAIYQKGHGSSPIKSYSIYCSPLAQVQIVDCDNENVRFRNQMSASSLGKDNLSAQKENLEYVVRQDKSSRTISILYEADNDGRIDFILANINGVVYKHVEKNVMHGAHETETFSCVGLPMGEYAIYIEWGRYKYCEKFFVK